MHLHAVRGIRTCGFFALVACAMVGCGPKAPPPEPVAKTNLQKVLRLYQVYVDKNQQGPPSEEALKEFGNKLTAQERTDYLIGDDLESIFTSPRDNQKFTLQYNLKLEPGGEVRAVAWETTGQEGKRFVALSMGYVEEYGELMFNEYKR